MKLKIERFPYSTAHEKGVIPFKFLINKLLLSYLFKLPFISFILLGFNNKLSSYFSNITSFNSFIFY